MPACLERTQAGIFVHDKFIADGSGVIIQVTFARVGCHGFVRNEQPHHDLQQNKLARTIWFL
jgi:hypothetical protein